MLNVWLINGMPASGKTTTARALAAKLPKSAHIDGDAIQDFIISGSRWPDGTPAEREVQIHLNVRNQCLLARSFAENGFIPILDYVVVNQERVKEYLGYLQGFNLYFVSLMPGPEVALVRDKARDNKKGTPGQWLHLDPIMRKELKDFGLWIDNSKLDVPGVIDAILSGHEKACITRSKQ